LRSSTVWPNTSICALFISSLALSEPGKTIVTFACDVGERSFSKLYNQEFLQEKGFPVENEIVAALFKRYQTQAMNGVVTV
jgi:cysteine synthase A